jgi:hypothetical protein
MGLLYRLHIMVKCVCYTGLWIHWFHNHCATIPNGSVTIGQTSLIGVSHSRLDSIVPLMLCTVCCTMVEALALYFRSLKTASTLLKRGHISGRPCDVVILRPKFINNKNKPLAIERILYDRAILRVSNLKDCRGFVTKFERLNLT